MNRFVGFTLTIGVTLLSACNTIHGAGKDAKSVGKAVTKTVGKAK